MFDIGASELLLTVIVAIVVIGPKDLPRALRMAGGWIAKIRRVSNHFRAGMEEMIRQAELEDMEKKWREKNAAIIQAEADGTTPAASAEPALPDWHAGEPQEADLHPMIPLPAPAEPAAEAAAPELPLGPPKASSRKASPPKRSPRKGQA
jgi:sec-independent protein translocase protein TatB